MAQDITIAKASYPSVPFVLLTKTGTSEKAKFVDTTDATATSADLMSGKTAYINGEKVAGTMAFATSEQIKQSFGKIFGAP